MRLLDGLKIAVLTALGMLFAIGVSVIASLAVYLGLSYTLPRMMDFIPDPNIWLLLCLQGLLLISLLVWLSIIRSNRKQLIEESKEEIYGRK